MIKQKKPTNFLSDNDVMIIVLNEQKKHSTNEIFISFLDDVIRGLDGKTHIEETASPRYKSVLEFSINMFPFSMKEYRDMAYELLEESNSNC